jgi:hypothetical protein
MGFELLPDLAGIVSGTVFVEESLETATLGPGHSNGGQILLNNILELAHIVHLH